MGDPIIEALESISAFKVYADCEAYPDVEFEIMLDNLPSQEQAVYALEDAGLPIARITLR